MRYILKCGDDFIKWLQWTAGVAPIIKKGSYDKALVLDEEYLNTFIKDSQETRLDAIQKKYPQIEFLKVKIEIQN